MPNNFVNAVLGILETKCLNVLHKSKNAILGRWYSKARVSKRPSHKSTACLRALYCTNLTCSDLNECQKNFVSIVLRDLAVAGAFFLCLGLTSPALRAQALPELPPLAIEHFDPV